MDVRTAEHADVVHLARIWYHGWQDAHAAILPAELAKDRTQDSFRQRLQHHLSGVLVAGAPGWPGGFAMVDGDELYQLYVDAAARGSGVAASLLAAAEARLAAGGVATAWLACAIGNARAAKFYEKHGWRRVGTMTNHLTTADGPFELTVWRYEKRLSVAG